MKSEKKLYGWVFVLMTVAYIGFILLLSVKTSHQKSPIYIGLDDAPTYIKEGFDSSSLVLPDFEDNSWFKLEGSKNPGSSEFVDKYRTPMFTFHDEKPMEFTYAINFDTSLQVMTYMRRNAIKPALFITAIADNWEVYLNGNLVDRQIYLDDDGNITIHKEKQLFYIPLDNSYLQEKNNLLIFRIICSPNYSGLGLYRDSGYYIDDLNNVQISHDSLPVMLTIGSFVFIIFYNIMIYFRNPSDRRHLYFVIMAFLFTIYTFSNTPMSYQLIENTRIIFLLEYTSLELLGLAIILFFKSIFENRLNLFDKILMGIIVVVVILTCLGGMQFAWDMLRVGQAITLFSCAYAAFHLYRNTYKDIKKYASTTSMGWGGAIVYVFSSTFHGNVFVGMTVSSFAVLYGVYMSVMHNFDPQNMIVWLSTLFISMAFALNDDVAKEKVAVQEQNYLLEEMVESRTKELEQQAMLANLANESKSRFLATMSHEIRTPLNAILGISEIQLMDQGISESTRESLGKLHTSAYGLLSIINDILDLSKIETGKMEIVSAEYEVASLIHDAVQLNIIRIGSKNIRFVLEVSPDMPKVLHGDELRIKQIFNNIISNAIKYTDEGTVTLKVSCEKIAGQSDQIYFVFSVADTGQGMKPEDIATLFDEYTRFNTAVNRTSEGTGLGMSITNNLVKLMNGKIEVESEFGVGSTFKVRLLQNCSNNEVIGKEVADNLNSFRFTSTQNSIKNIVDIEPMPYGRVLIVDDVDTNIFVAKGLMAVYGLQIESATSGIEAIEKVKNGEVYDIIFMDHMMPVMDGMKATEIIRSYRYEGIIVALTANAISGNAAMFTSNGFNDFLSKPIDIKRLDYILNRYIKDKQPSEVIENARKNKPAQPQPLTETQNELMKIFRRDANKALITLPDTIMKKDYDLFTITVHAMKSALANVGQQELSDKAFELEKAGKRNDVTYITQNVDEFLVKLAELAQVEEPDTEEEQHIQGDEDTLFLAEKLAVIKSACDEYDEDMAQKALSELKTKKWSRKTTQLFEQISEMLLHSDFDEIVELIDDTQNILT